MSLYIQRNVCIFICKTTNRNIIIFIKFKKIEIFSSTGHLVLRSTDSLNGITAQVPALMKSLSADMGVFQYKIET